MRFGGVGSRFREVGETHRMPRSCISESLDDTRSPPRWEVLLFLVTWTVSFTLGTAAFGQPNPGQTSSTPPWKRQLSGEAASRVQELEHQIAQLQSEGRFSDAIAPAREAAEIRTRLQGADHWQAADARRAVDDLRKIAALPEEGRKAMASVAGARRKGRRGAPAWTLRGSRTRQPHPAGDPPEMAGG